MKVWTSGTAVAALLTILLVAAPSSGQNDVRKFLAYDGGPCDPEMAYLDNYAMGVQIDPRQQAYVVIYGGRRGTARHELRERTARVRRCLVENRKIEPHRVTVVNGGYRERLTVGLWLMAQGTKLPDVSPTVPLKEVRFKRTKRHFNCSSFY